MVEDEYANSVDPVVVAVDPVATTVAAAWGLDLWQLFDMGKGRLDSKETRICLICVDVCYFLRLCQGDGSFAESLGTTILWPHAKLLPRPLFLL